MVALFVNGSRIGTLVDAEPQMLKFMADNVPVEMRDEPSGRILGTIRPEPLVPWDHTITRADLDRIAGEPTSTLAEIRQRRGMQ